MFSSRKVLFNLAVASMLVLLIANTFQPTLAGGDKDTIVINGNHGCGPKLLLKHDKNHETLVMNDHCKEEKHYKKDDNHHYGHDHYEEEHHYMDNHYDDDDHYDSHY